MTPKEKANEITLKFYRMEHQDSIQESWIDMVLARRCSLICVDEILLLLKNTVNAEENFWNKVRIELQKY